MTNHLRRIMHILDIISGVSMSSKCTEIVGGWGLASYPTMGAYSGSPNSLAEFKGPTSKAPTSKSRGKDGRGREGRRVEGSPK